MSRAACALLAAGAAAAVPLPAFACAVCGASNSQTAMAFLWMTLMLSALPLVMIGGGVFWLWSRARAEDRRAREVLAPLQGRAALPQAQPAPAGAWPLAVALNPSAAEGEAAR